jgi:cysteinyl-tRNA synthetase
MNKFFLYNTLSRQKEVFKPKFENDIRMYVCGPTVYDHPHVGNARPLIVFDLLFRILQKLYKAKNVTYVRNITDIDDKIIETSQKQNIDISQLTKIVTKYFHEDCVYLGCLAPNVEPKATEHIKEMIELTSKLVELNYAYVESQHVYFDVTKYADYGKLSNKKIDELVAGSRVEISEIKKNPADFVLWKPSSDVEPGWNSPWGRGRPGWHLECSAMSEKYLGKEFDIHGGGLDLIFPHHENEIAQSNCANSTDSFAKYWMHNGYVTVNKQKMSKSLGNFITIDELKSKYDGQVLRLAMLSTHYRQPFDWNDKILEDAKKTLGKWYAFYSEETTEINEENINPLLDDLNTPLFISNLHSLFDRASKGDKGSAQQLSAACKLVGLFNKDLATWSNSSISKLIDENEIENLLRERNIAREEKDFTKSDQIRDVLNSKGIVIEDKDGKTNWKYK